MVKVYESSNGLKITVGQSATENDRIRKCASQKDLWFHLDNVASPHVILSAPKSGAITRQDITEAAQLVKFYSKQKSSARSSVIYINVKRVKKVPEIDGRCELSAKPEQLTVFQADSDLLDGLRLVS